MAWTQGGTIGASEVNNWYTSLNKTIGSYGGGIAQLSNPIRAGRDVYASDLNNLITKLNELKRDEYLSQASYGSYSSVSVGQIIRASDWTGINSSISSLTGVKCRNRATYTNGASSTTNSNGVCRQGYDSNGTDQNGGMWANTCINSWYDNSSNSHGTNSASPNRNGSRVDIWCQNSTG